MKKKLILVTLCLAWLGMHGQKKQPGTNKAPKKEMTSVDVVGAYERIAAKGYKTPPDMLLKVANACYFRSDLVAAAKFYGELFEVIPEQEAVVYYRYAQSLKAVKEFSKADEMMAVFQKKSK